MKLPKQWKDWCRAARLRPSSRYLDRRWPDAWMYLRGHWRLWRLDCNGKLQCGDTYENFDRWALCDIREADCPLTRAEFVMFQSSPVTSDGRNCPRITIRNRRRNLGHCANLRTFSLPGTIKQAFRELFVYTTTTSVLREPYAAEGVAPGPRRGRHS